jgi:hypothetical protein
MTLCSEGHRYTPTTRHGRCPICVRDKQRYADDPHRQVLSSYAWQKARKAARARDGNRCVYADKGDCYGQLEVHHLISVRRGGDPFALDNLVSLPRSSRGNRGSNGKRLGSRRDFFSTIHLTPRHFSAGERPRGKSGAIPSLLPRRSTTPRLGARSVDFVGGASRGRRSS